MRSHPRHDMETRSYRHIELVAGKLFLMGKSAVEAPSDVKLRLSRTLPLAERLKIRSKMAGCQRRILFGSVLILPFRVGGPPPTPPLAKTTLRQEAMVLISLVRIRTQSLVCTTSFTGSILRSRAAGFRPIPRESRLWTSVIPRGGWPTSTSEQCFFKTLTPNNWGCAPSRAFREGAVGQPPPSLLLVIPIRNAADSKLHVILFH
jgi:hypothetical protein